ncbi:MAG: beta-propeller domain-containing protein [bacterium]
MPKKQLALSISLIFLFLCILCLIATGLIYWFLKQPGSATDTINNQEFKMQQFKSEADFQKYLATNLNTNLNNYGFAGASLLPAQMNLSKTMEATSGSTPTSDTTERYSDTYVQVAGVDEPDSVKTDGTNIFVSSEQFVKLMQTTKIGISNDSYLQNFQGETNIFSALPAERLAQIASINTAGNLLLAGNTLLVETGNSLQAYDVSKASLPKASWQLELDPSTSIVDARRIAESLYLIVQTNNINSNFAKCAIPLAKNLEIRCTDLYYPTVSSENIATYSVLKLNYQTGAIEDKLSFLGGSGTTTIYLNSENLFIAYGIYPDNTQLTYDFLTSGNGLYPAEVVAQIKKVNGYDLSKEAKSLEFQTILNNYQNTLTAEAKEILLENTTTAATQFFDNHKREFSATGIVKVKLAGLQQVAVGKVPGSLLNQFSLDESNNYLRVATSSSNWLGNGETFNDLYVLNQDLKQVGAILDYGLGEKIFGVRFMGDQAYVVTFKQIDPFYVMDLSNPKNPQKVGELKIPGYSSFLHQINKNLVLGVGQEDSKVKVALYDVSDPASPRELDKVIISEFWTAIQQSHHAFLIDPENQVFVIPTGSSAYIYSYQGNKLTLKKLVPEINAQRSLYINNSIYIIATNEIKVVDEKSWEIVKRLSF